MKIFDEKNNKTLKSLTLLLSKSEAIQFIGYLEELVSEGAEKEHFHLNNEDYSKEITLALYDVNDINHFSDRYKKLILEDE